MRGPEHRAGLGCTPGRTGVLVDELGNAEIDHLDRVPETPSFGILCQEDVVRLQIAMNDAGLVRGLERSSHLRDDGGDLRQEQRPRLLDHLLERLALEVLHHDERIAGVGHAIVVNLHRVTTVDASCRLAFVLETATRFGASSELWMKELDRDRMAEGLVSPSPDRTHPALAEQDFDLVTAGNHDAREIGRR